MIPGSLESIGKAPMFGTMGRLVCDEFTGEPPVFFRNPPQVVCDHRSTGEPAMFGGIRPALCLTSTADFFRPRSLLT